MGYFDNSREDIMSDAGGIASFVCGIFRDVRRDSYAQLAILEEIF